MLKKQKLGTKILMVVLGALLILSSLIGCATEKPTPTSLPKEAVVFGYGGWDTQQWMSEIASFIV